MRYLDQSQCLLRTDQSLHNQQYENVNKKSIQIYLQCYLCNLNFQRFYLVIDKTSWFENNDKWRFDEITHEKCDQNVNF